MRKRNIDLLQMKSVVHPSALDIIRHDINLAELPRERRFKEAA